MPLSIVRYRGEINKHGGVNCLLGTFNVLRAPSVLKLCILWSYPDINPCPDHNMLIVIMTMFSVGVV